MRSDCSEERSVSVFRMTDISPIIHNEQGRDSSVSIATRYGLDGPGIESQWGEILRTCPYGL